MPLQLFEDYVYHVLQRSSIDAVESHTRIDGHAGRGVRGNGRGGVAVSRATASTLGLARLVPGDGRKVSV